MLLGFSLTNFQSFRKTVQISLKVNDQVPEDDRFCKSPAGTRLSKAIAVIGPNASGKTTLIKALAFVDQFVASSFQNKPEDPIPLSPHFSEENKPCSFEVMFEADRREWRYKLKASRERVYHESLYSKRSRAFSYVFKRDWNEKKRGYDIQQQQFGMLQKESEKVRENASLISTASQYGVEQAKFFPSIHVRTNVGGIGRQTMNPDQIIRASEYYEKNSEIREDMAALLGQWDLGLADVHVVKQTIAYGNETRDIYFPVSVHRGVGNKEHKLDFWHESSGTQGAFLLLSRILPVLRYGGLAVIDELEADLHPCMLIPILDLFFSPKTNPHNAQIIFTCHSIEVLALLHKSQVVLVEKDDQGESDAWRLDSVKGIRADDNLYAKYMAGAYGAIPRL